MMSRYYDERTQDVKVGMALRDIGLVLIVVIAAGMGGCPLYNVWNQGLVGQAELRRAERNRQIKIQEAKAGQESAVHWAQAEIERAKGVAQANQIIGESLHNNEAYLRYLWIHALSEGKNEVIYVPTEANLPILEANRFGQRNK
jgi:hypothetical protein